MNVFFEINATEITNLKARITSELGFTPKSDLPEDIQAEVYAHGWGHPDLIPSWKEELANPQLTYVNCFDGKEYPIKEKKIAERQDELRRMIERHEGRKQIPLSLDRELDKLIQLQYDWEEENFWEDEEDIVERKIGLPDSPNDVPDEWYERG